MLNFYDIVSLTILKIDINDIYMNKQTNNILKANITCNCKVLKLKSFVFFELGDQVLGYLFHFFLVAFNGAILMIPIFLREDDEDTDVFWSCLIDV